MFKKYNPNPCGKKVGDCVIRALSKVFDLPWETIYLELCYLGLNMCDMPSSNSVWGRFLKENGFKQRPIDFMTVKDFAENNPVGRYVLATGSHAIAVINGTYYDAWDSGQEQPIYFYYEED